MTFKVVATLVFVATFSGFASAAKPMNGVPALQVIAPNGAVSTLVGTMHVGYTGLRQPDPSLLDKARTLVIEHSLDNALQDNDYAPESFAALEATGKLGRANWAKSLDGKQLERLRSNLACLMNQPVAPDELDAFLITRTPRLLSGIVFLPCPSSAGRDALLIEAARKRRVAIVELESQAEIAARRRAIPDHVYLQLLRYGLETDLDGLYRGLVRALNQGDYSAIARTVTASYETPTDAALSHRILVSERNIAWMPRLIAELNAGNAVIAVGAAHLPGKDGIVTLLTNAGYKVLPIMVPGQTTP